MSDATGKVTVNNERGLHVRIATRIVQVASSYPCDVFVEKGGQEVNGKSIMGLLMLVASKGSVLTIRAAGDRSEEAVAELIALIEAYVDTEGG